MIEEIKCNKDAICNDILRSLPAWFGIEEAIQDYVKGVESLPMFVCKTEDQIAGFISLKRHNKYTAEIYVMGVRKESHGDNPCLLMIKQLCEDRGHE